MLKLTNDNYFSFEADKEYMSASQFKGFERCESKQLAIIKGEYLKDSKDAFVEGHYFEALINGTDDIFVMQHPDMISKTGPTKGQIKSNFKKVITSAEAFKNQPLFMNYLKNSEQQKVMTGNIAGVPFKICIDLYNEFLCNDTKCVKDFKKVYSEVDKAYVSWYFAYGYHYQQAIYKAISGIPQAMLATTKEDVPDTAFLQFSDGILNNALEIVEEFAPRYHAIKNGEIEPESCGICDYCRKNKQIEEIFIIEDYI